MVKKGTVVEGDAHTGFFHRKLAKSGGSRYLAVGKILPVSWTFVQVSVEKLEGDVCLLKIKKLA